MRKFLLILTLTLCTTEASARFEDWDLVGAIEKSKYAVVAKVTKVEMFNNTIAPKSSPCGFSLYVEVIDDLKGNAPKFLSLGSFDSVSANHNYLMIVEEGRAKFYTDTVTHDTKTHIEAVANCESNLPEYSVNHLIMGEIVENRELKERKWGVGSRWLKKPVYLTIPNHIDMIVYKPITTDVIKGAAADVNNKIKAATEQGQLDIVIGDRLSDNDFLPSGDIRFGETFVNWTQLKQVWITSQQLEREL